MTRVLIKFGTLMEGRSAELNCNLYLVNQDHQNEYLAL